ncbi:MAG: murein L,D-transpeptidase family protein [Candidatus Brocadiia bacterium]
MHPYFRKSGIDYPPKKIVLIGLKREKLLEVWASMEDSRYSLVRTYPILSTSGEPGPKLQEGDGQMPEGFYRIESLNPNSSYHLSLRINYPNDFDLRHARREGRTNPGGDIMIHGGRASLGCLAMGDRVAEELFVLAADVGVKNIRVIMSPVDFRKGAEVVSRESMPPWTDELYAQIKSELEVLQTDAGR